MCVLPFSCLPFGFCCFSARQAMRKTLRLMALGWRAMRWIPALRICVAASLLADRAAHAANDTSRIADWILRPHVSEQKDKKQKEKRLDRCTAQLTNAGKISMIFSLDTPYMSATLRYTRALHVP